MFGFLKPKLTAEGLGIVLAKGARAALTETSQNFQQLIDLLIRNGADPDIIRVEICAFMVFASVFTVTLGVKHKKMNETKCQSAITALEHELRNSDQNEYADSLCLHYFGAKFPAFIDGRVGEYSEIVNMKGVSSNEIQTSLIERFCGFVCDREASAGLKLQALSIYVMSSGAAGDIISGIRII
jgi:hypothetical protein